MIATVTAKRLLLCLAFLVAAAAPAGATAIFEASAFATLTIDSIVNTTSTAAPNISIFGAASVFDHGSFVFGPGASATDSPNAAILGLNPMGIGDGLVHSGVVTGQAGPEEALAFVETNGTLELENLSSMDELLVQLSLEYSLEALATIDFPDEDAASFAEVVLFTNNFAIDFFSFAEADAFFGPPSDFDADTRVFDLMLAPGQIVDLTLFVDTDGFALSSRSVFEPSTLWLLGVGILASAQARRRRRGTPNTRGRACF